MKFVHDDGGRAAAGYRGDAGDCGCRAIAIATGIPYQQVYDRLKVMAGAERITGRKRGRSSVRDGLRRETMNRFMREIGWRWVPTMFIGSGCKVHVKASELPKGKLILNLSKHYAAVIDGVLHDTYDCSRGETRCVYGYWQPVVVPLREGINV